MSWTFPRCARAAVPTALALALMTSACVTPERPAAPDGAPDTAVATGADEPTVADAAAAGTAVGAVGALSDTLPPGSTLVTEGTPVTIDLAGGGAGAAGGAPIVVLGEPTVKGLAVFMGDSVRDYAAAITEAASLRDALAKDPTLLTNPRWLGHAVNVAEQTKLTAQIIDSGLRGGQWDDEARPMADEIGRNVVVPMVTSTSAFLAAAQGGDAERAVDGLTGMSLAVDNLALAMTGLRDELLRREGGAPVED